jgi:hypothetical protein
MAQDNLSFILIPDRVSPLIPGPALIPDSYLLIPDIPVSRSDD